MCSSAAPGSTAPASLEASPAAAVGEEMNPAAVEAADPAAPFADDDDVAGAGEEGDDPMARFAVAAARQQAAERGEDEDAGVDMSFINRALAESRRMRAAANKDQLKRKEQLAQLCARHGESSAQYMADAMQEHAAEVLTEQQQQSLASVDEQEDATASC